MTRTFVAPLAILAATLAGCSANVIPAPGQLMVVLGTDLTPGRDFDTLAIRVTNARVAGELYYDWRFRSRADGTFEGDLALPATVAVVAGERAGGPTTIRVEARLGGTVRIVREARVIVPSSGVQMLRMSLDWLCWDMMPTGVANANARETCAEGSACAAGACVSADADGSSLASWDSAMVFGSSGKDTAGGACFEVIGCFLRSAAVVPTVDPGGVCAFAYRGDGTNLNVAVALPPSYGRGFCAKDVCLVPLDRDASVGGWRLEAGRVVVPRRVCTEGLPLAVSTSCATKTESRPPCAEWSSVGVASSANAPAVTIDLRPADGGL
jgi:hypothetical protein